MGSFQLHVMDSFTTRRPDGAIRYYGFFQLHVMDSGATGSNTTYQYWIGLFQLHVMDSWGGGGREGRGCTASLSTPCNGFLELGLPSLPLFQLPVLSTPCNGFLGLEAVYHGTTDGKLYLSTPCNGFR